MTNRQRIIRLLGKGVSPADAARIVGCTAEIARSIKWQINNPDKTRAYQRTVYAKQAARNGRRPSNEAILSLAKSHTYNQIADRFGISRNVIAGVVNRSKRA